MREGSITNSQCPMSNLVKMVKMVEWLSSERVKKLKSKKVGK